MRRLLVAGCPDETWDLAVIAWQPDGLSPTAFLSDGKTHHGVSVRQATPADVTAVFVAQCEAEGKGKELREGPRGQMWALPGHDGPQVLRWLNLSALLDPEAGSEEVQPPPTIPVKPTFLRELFEALCDPAPYPGRECSKCGCWVNTQDHKGDECPHCGGTLVGDEEDRWLCRACDGISWETEEDAKKCDDCEAARSAFADRILELLKGQTREGKGGQDE